MGSLEKYLYYDKPVPYKGLLIYPVLMSDYVDFGLYSNCLLLDKNSIADVKIISMSYLRYLFYTIENGQPYLYYFIELLYMVLRMSHENDEIKFLLEEKTENPFFTIKGEKYDSNDFENIKKIIFEQNCLTDIDETIDKDIRDKMLEAKEYKIKESGIKRGSLEDQMICLSISSPYKLEDIYGMTIRKFNKMLQRIDHKLHYEINKNAEMSGMVKFKEGTSLGHWMDDLSVEDNFKDVKMSVDEVQKKIGN